MKSISLRSQILALALSLVAVVIVLLSVLTIVQVRTQMREGMENRAVSIALMISESVMPALEFGDSTFVAEYVNAVFKDPDVVGVCVCDINDKVIHRKTRGFEGNLEDFESAVSDSLRVEHRDGLCIVSSRIVHGSVPLGSMWLLLSEESTRAHTMESIVAVLTGALILLILVVIIGNSVSRKIVQPIRIFEKAAEKVRIGNLDSPVDPSELQRDFHSLAEAFNQMQRSLKDAFEELHRSEEYLKTRVDERTTELRHELSERRRAEAALQENSELMSSIIESVGDGILVLEGGKRVTHWNLRFAEMWKLPLDVMRKGDAEGLLPHLLRLLVDPDAYIERLRKLDLGEADESATLELKDGRVFEHYSTHLVFGNGLSGRLCSFRDVTERIQAERQRQQLQRDLDRARRMESLGILAGGVAHDLNNLLGPLVGYPSLILETMDPEDVNFAFVKSMGEAASRSASVIQDLLTLARRGRYEMQIIDLNQVLHEYLNSPSFAKLSRSRPGVKVKTSVCDDTLPLVGSSSHLHKAIMNLVVNAYDAIGNVGELQISTCKEYVDKMQSGRGEIAPGEYVTLRVKDNGAGISQDELHRIFEPYYSRKQMSSSSGTGLGLSVVHGVIKDHGGFYDVNSVEGQGTEFILYFPVADDIPEPDAESQEVMKGKGSILVVDDEPGQRQLAKALLESLGYDVATASSGSAALKSLNDHPVDLLLLDMIMEDGFDGLDTYREALKINPTQRAIMVSGYAATERVEEALRLGAGQYVKKPYTRHTLAAAVGVEMQAQRERAATS